MPGLIGSLLLLISGAVARYAYSESVIRWTTGDEAHSLRVDTIGLILIVAGLVALVLSIAYAFMDDRETLVEEENVVVDDVPEVLPPKTAVKRSRRSRKSGY